MARDREEKRSEAHKSAYAALIGKISERDRAKDVEQFDDILRTFINETNKFENRFGEIRDEEKMLAVKKLLPESQLNDRFRGSTMSNSELLVALENIIIDNVATIPTARNRTVVDTSAPMGVGMAAKDDGEHSREEGDQRIMDIACRLYPKEQAKATGSSSLCTGCDHRGGYCNSGGYDNCLRRQWRLQERR